jgi:hypothetical protein
MERASRMAGATMSATGRGWKGRAAGYASAALVALLLGLIYHRTAAGLWTIWTTNDNYSHGSLVPLVSLALVASRRERLRVLPRTGDWRGLALVALACALQVLGARADVFTLQGWSFVVMLFGKKQRTTFLGTLLFGFGLIFFGMKIMVDADMEIVARETRP